MKAFRRKLLLYLGQKLRTVCMQFTYAGEVDVLFFILISKFITEEQR